MKVFFDSKAKSTGVDATALNKISFGVSMEDLYFLDDPCHFAQRDFFKHATGIHDNVALKEHIFDIARTAFQVFPYPCIWGEWWRIPFWSHIQLGRVRIGCDDPVVS